MRLRTFYCSTCHASHPFERVADVWVSRQNCPKVLPVRATRSLAILAYAVERGLEVHEVKLLSQREFEFHGE